ncbi:serine/threonine-protein kinase [Streptomyces sp. NPDC058290]|uniref:serine/threonine-protein kinase n=1 Tax=Streptomyces sp. NPDC058290 TaxID=3346426 RepID=UPI0036E92202
MVAVHDVVVEDGIPWIVMRLVEGRSLEAHLRAEGPMPAVRVAQVATALLKALQAAHVAGIVHRDLKPANVMIASDGDVLLADFGIAVHKADTALTVTGGVVGSAEYMAPERLNGMEDQGAGDLFSLGVTLYEALEGWSPFRRETPTATLAAVALHHPPPPQRADTPLTSLITALLAKDPADRPTIDSVHPNLVGSDRVRFLRSGRAVHPDRHDGPLRCRTGLGRRQHPGTGGDNGVAARPGGGRRRHRRGLAGHRPLSPRHPRHLESAEPRHRERRKRGGGVRQSSEGRRLGSPRRDPVHLGSRRAHAHPGRVRSNPLTPKPPRASARDLVVRHAGGAKPRARAVRVRG